MHQPILIPILGKESGNRWILTGYWDGSQPYKNDWVYLFTVKGVEHRLRIPANFKEFDGASVPSFLRSIVRMGGRDMPDEAWVPHDYLYFYKGRVPSGHLQILKKNKWVDVKFVNRKWVDKVFHRELRKPVHSLASFKAPLAYLGLRFVFWKNCS